MSSIKVLNIGRGNKISVSTNKTSSYVEMGEFKGSRELMKASHTMIGIHRNKCRKLPWWKRFWKRLFGVKTPDYTVGNYD